MSDTCIQLSDRMPAVARGAERWSNQESAHLASCASCAAEWRLVTTAIALGQRVPTGAPPDEVAATVLGRLHRERARSGRRLRVGWGVAGLAAAALVALLLWRGQAPAPPTLEAGAAEIATIQLPALDSLSADELEQVLEGFAGPITEMTTDVSAPDLETLDSTELERVLDALEG